MNIIELHKTALIELCKKHHVKTLYVFGSALREDFKEDSDVDFLVLFDREVLNEPMIFASNYWDFEKALKLELNREIDLLTEESIRNRFFKMELDLTKQLLYAA